MNIKSIKNSRSVLLLLLFMSLTNNFAMNPSGSKEKEIEISDQSCNGNSQGVIPFSPLRLDQLCLLAIGQHIKESVDTKDPKKDIDYFKSILEQADSCQNAPILWNYFYRNTQPTWQLISKLPGVHITDFMKDDKHFFFIDNSGQNIGVINLQKPHCTRFYSIDRFFNKKSNLCNNKFVMPVRKKIIAVASEKECLLFSRKFDKCLGKFSVNGATAIVQSYSDNILIIPQKSGKILIAELISDTEDHFAVVTKEIELPIEGEVTLITFSSDGKQLMAKNRFNIFLFDLTSNPIKLIKSFSFSKQGINVAAKTYCLPNTNTVVIKSDNNDFITTYGGNIILYDFDTDRKRVGQMEGQIITITADHHIITSPKSGELAAMDLSFKILNRYEINKEYKRCGFFSRSSKIMGLILHPFFNDTQFYLSYSPSINKLEQLLYKLAIEKAGRNGFTRHLNDLHEVLESFEESEQFTLKSRAINLYNNIQYSSSVRIKIMEDLIKTILEPALENNDLLDFMNIDAEWLEPYDDKLRKDILGHFEIRIQSFCKNQLEAALENKLDFIQSNYAFKYLCMKQSAFPVRFFTYLIEDNKRNFKRLKQIKRLKIRDALIELGCDPTQLSCPQQAIENLTFNAQRAIEEAIGDYYLNRLKKLVSPDFWPCSKKRADILKQYAKEQLAVRLQEFAHTKNKDDFNELYDQYSGTDLFTKNELTELRGLHLVRTKEQEICACQDANSCRSIANTLRRLRVSENQYNQLLNTVKAVMCSVYIPRIKKYIDSLNLSINTKGYIRHYNEVSVELKDFLTQDRDILPDDFAGRIGKELQKLYVHKRVIYNDGGMEYANFNADQQKLYDDSQFARKMKACQQEVNMLDEIYKTKKPLPTLVY